MPNVEVRTAVDAEALDRSDADTIALDLAQHFDGVRCFTHEIQPHVIATLQPGGGLDFTALVCCRETAEAVDVILGQYRAHKPR